MRTTVTLQDDVAKAVERLRREQGSGMSEIINDLIRRGLARPPEASRPFRQQTSDMGARLDVTNVAQVLEDVEGPQAR